VSVPRRTILGLGLAGATVTLTGCRDEPPTATWRATPTQPVDPSAQGSALPGSPTAGDAGLGPAEAPAQASEERVTRTLARYLAPTDDNPRHPAYAGAVALAQVNGRLAVHTAVGNALRYGIGPTLLSPDRRVAMRPDSIFDLASVTKLYTAILALQQVDKGRIDLDAPVVTYLPEFTGPGKSSITVAMLLSHTGGLPVGAAVRGSGTLADRWKAVLATPLVSGAVPGAVFRYSSVGFMVIGRLVEKVTGRRLDQALRSGLTDPLGLRHTGFNPTSWLSSTERQTMLVATDARSSRGLLRGVVHDDVANRLGGIAGHAGIFSTAAEVAVIGQLLLNGGTYRGRRILAEPTVRRMLTNANTGLPAVDAERPHRTSDHGLGIVLNQPWFMGRLSTPATFGHTGFTGTSLLVSPARRLVLVLLTNRAHPDWRWANPDPVRVAVSNTVAG